jgi:nitroreductase
LDTYESIATKLDVREFSSRPVPVEIKRKVLEAARLAQSGSNLQHWRFILVEGKENQKRLADDSTTGRWVAGADFAVIVLTNPRYPFHLLDAGRVTQNMQLAAWNFGVASGVFTGIDRRALARDFGIPEELNPSIVIGFGYPVKKIIGKKNRKPLGELAFQGKYGKKLTI